jgi:predicted O-methyltransferase YrrM
MATSNFFTSAHHEQDPRWTAVDAYTLQHSHPSTRPNTSALEQTLAASQAGGLPDIAAAPAQAKFMALMCRALGVTHALEVGTLGGYTAIWLASENPGLHLTSVEFKPHNAKVARANILAAGLSDRIEVLEGAGMDILPRLKAEVQAGTRPKFGFTFLDADKANNWNYFDLAADMTITKGVICVDNVVRQGKLVAEESQQDPATLGSRAVIEKAGADARVDSVVIQKVGEKSYDGCLWAVVN